LLSSTRRPPALLSFPTRRSSDLSPTVTCCSPATRPGERSRSSIVVRSLRGRFPSVAEFFGHGRQRGVLHVVHRQPVRFERPVPSDRKSTRLNSSHVSISYAVFCL